MVSMPAHSKKYQYLPQIQLLMSQGLSVAQAAEGFPVHYNTILEWLKQDSITLPPIGTGPRKTRDHKVYTKQCFWCGDDFESPRKNSKFCSRKCTNTWQRSTADTRRQSERVCPCGGVVPKRTEEGKKTYTYRKYCSDTCRDQYQEHRQKVPENYVTFDCERCGKEVTRYKKLKTFRFCSNECSAKSNTQRRVSVDDVVLDSSYEALFWGLCCMFKIPIERFDREGVVQHKDGWYGPDFVVDGIYVEVKGLEDQDDRDRYAEWRKEHGPLVILDYSRLNTLRQSEFVETVNIKLKSWEE